MLSTFASAKPGDRSVIARDELGAPHRADLDDRFHDERASPRDYRLGDAAIAPVRCIWRRAGRSGLPARCAWAPALARLPFPKQLSAAVLWAPW